MQKRRPTESQRQAAKERRAKMRTLAKSIGAMSADDRLAMFTDSDVVTIEGRTLSIFNTCMLLSQSPGSTVVGGFRQWKRAGRSVRKGQHGAAIWIPIGKRETDKETGDKDTDKVGFTLTTMFDVSQTEETDGVPC